MERTNYSFKGDIYALSDIGKKRKNNEDAAYCAKSQYGILLCVADGMGGHRKGEVASKMVIDSLSVPFQSARHLFSSRRAKSFLAKYSKSVNKEIYNLAISSDEYKEMGTTESAALVNKDSTVILSVGDSRIYSYKKDRGLLQVTKDQSYVELLFETGRINKSEMKTHPQRNLLTNAVGLNNILTNYEEIVIENDYDSLLLCTDGLYNMVSDEDIEAVLSNTETTVKEKSEKLISLALENGGTDNVAVVILELDNVREC